MGLTKRVQELETLLSRSVASEALAEVRAALTDLMAEVRRSEQQLRESEERYRALVDASFEGILIAVDARIVEANEAVAQMSGYCREELIGMGPMQLMTPESARLSIDYMKRGVTDPYLIDAVRKDGSVIRVEIHGRNVTYRGKRARATSLRDVTDREQQRQRLDEERRHFDAKVQQAQRLQSIAVLAGGVAHDFNNLLLAILGNTELAMMRLPTDSNARDALKQVQVAAHNAADLTKQLLAYGGRGQFVVQPLSLNELVTEMSKLLRVSIPRLVSVEMQLDAQLPLIEGDPSQLRQVAMNLITNAADAMGERGGTITLTTATVQLTPADVQAIQLPEQPKPGHYVCLQVRDTGQGIDTTTQSHMFEPFYTTKFTGRGLGLAAVLGIVRGHCGALSVESNVGHGTTFTVYLPAPVLAVAAAQAQHEPTHQWDQQATVLVVDDEPAVLEVTARMLSHTGLQVIKAASGVEALATYQRYHAQISLVLLDLTMPDLNGEETLRRLRELNPDVRVVVTSGYTLTEGSAPPPGANGFLAKPYTLGRLTEMLANVLG